MHTERYIFFSALRNNTRTHTHYIFVNTPAACFLGYICFSSFFSPLEVRVCICGYVQSFHFIRLFVTTFFIDFVVILFLIFFYLLFVIFIFGLCFIHSWSRLLLPVSLHSVYLGCFLFLIWFFGTSLCMCAFLALCIRVRLYFSKLRFHSLCFISFSFKTINVKIIIISFKKGKNFYVFA